MPGKRKARQSSSPGDCNTQYDKKQRSLEGYIKVVHRSSTSASNVSELGIPPINYRRCSSDSNISKHSLEAGVDNSDTSQCKSVSDCALDQSLEKDIASSSMGDLTLSKMQEMLDNVEQRLTKKNADMLRSEMSKFDSLETNLEKKFAKQITDLGESVRTEISESSKIANSKVEDVEESIQFAVNDIDDLKSELHEEKAFSGKLADFVNTLAVKVDVLIAQNEETEKRSIRSEDLSYYNSLLIFEVPEAKNENCEETVRNIFERRLKVENVQELKIIKCSRQGAFQNKRRRPINVKFDSVIDRNAVLACRKNLGFDSDIKIAEQFSAETAARRKVLGPLVKECKDAGKKATLIGDQILVDGKKFSIENIHTLEGIDHQKPATRKNDKILAFNGRLSMLSNFYSCRFVVDKVTFWSNEQYFQYCKALAAGKSRIATKILANKNPVEQKSLGGSIRIQDSDWRSHECMKAGAIVKFSQNKMLWDYLKSTAGLELLHTNAYDSDWGTGVALRDKDLFKKQGKGKNLLGKILMDIRDNNLVALANKPSDIISPQLQSQGAERELHVPMEQDKKEILGSNKS